MNINITIRDKVATAPADVLIVCGNSDYSILFDFDEPWQAYDLKTARFIYQTRADKVVYRDIVFSGNECPVPVLSGVTQVKVGVYAGDLHTTTAAVVPCKRSILCGAPAHDDPPEDVYHQIMEQLKGLELVSIVTELPEVGAENKTYFVPKTDGSGVDLYDEYMWINGAWEYIGTKQIEIDLSDYVKKTDVATAGGDAGLVKLSALNYGVEIVASNGCLRLQQPNDYLLNNVMERTSAKYTAVTLGWLDKALKASITTNTQTLTDEEKSAVLAWLGAIGATDYPDAADKAGVVKVNSGAYGIGVYPTNGYLYIAPASNEEIDAKTHARRPIVPSNLDYAIKVGLTTNANKLTEQEQAAIHKWLGLITATNEARPYTIVKRTAGGVIFVGEPTADAHATNKGYVDGLIAGLQAQIDALKGGET